MAGRDITERIPMNIGNPGTSDFWINSAEAYDIAVGGLPFLLAPTDTNPYQRETAPYRKDQFDNGKEPGEQSLTGWWLRSQSSFHAGSGIKFFDPTSGEANSYRFTDSQGVNVFTKGQVTLLNEVIAGHITTTATNTEESRAQEMRPIKWNGINGVLVHDGYDVDKIDATGTETHFINYLAGTADKVYAICDDGQFAYWVTNDSVGGKFQMWKKELTKIDTDPAALMFDSPGLTIQHAKMDFIKDRIVMCVNNKVYQVSPTATVMPTPVYTNPNTNYMYTDITASGPAIYTSGFSGMYSTIQKYTLTSNGEMPVLTQAITAAEFPGGERVHAIRYYLGYILIGTNKGIRVANINEQDGSVSYGPLIVETVQPVYDFAFRDRFAWAACGVGTDAGLVRIDLGTTVEGESTAGGYSNQLRFAYANDLQYSQTTHHHTTGVAFIGETDKLAFCTAHDETLNENGHIYVETDNLRPTGYVTTGAIRYSTLESKHFKFIRARGSFSKGAMDIASIAEDGTIYSIVTYDKNVGSPEVATSSPEVAQEFMSFKFTLSRDASSIQEGPTFTGYQVKALPATKGQRLIQFPVWCFDVEKDRFNVVTGYKGRAWERIQELEDVESRRDVVNIQDFTVGERVQGVIEKVSFIRRTPPNGDFEGFGGVLLITVRTVL